MIYLNRFLHLGFSLLKDAPRKQFNANSQYVTFWQWLLNAAVHKWIAPLHPLITNMNRSTINWTQCTDKWLHLIVPAARWFSHQWAELLKDGRIWSQARIAWTSLLTFFQVYQKALSTSERKFIPKKNLYEWRQIKASRLKFCFGLHGYDSLVVVFPFQCGTTQILILRNYAPPLLFSLCYSVYRSTWLPGKDREPHSTEQNL